MVWLLLLPAGIATLLLMRSLDLVPVSDSGFGNYQGHVLGEISDTGKGVSAGFEGRSESKWGWTPPGTFRYSEVHFRWAGPGSKGEGPLVLSGMTLDSNGQRHVINRDWFQKLLKNPSLADECAQVLEDARDGGLATPGDPPKSYNRNSIRRSLDHRLEGFIIPYSVAAWTGFWCIGWLFIHKFRKR